MRRIVSLSSSLSSGRKHFGFQITKSRRNFYTLIERRSFSRGRDPSRTSAANFAVMQKHIARFRDVVGVVVCFKGATMKRREFIKAAAGPVAVWPLAARAQRGDRVRSLAVLMGVEESDPEAKAQLSGFTQALAQLGWTEGRNLRMEVRWGGGSDVDRARSLAKELVALKPDVILSQGTPVTAAFKRETQIIPIVFVVVTDPVGDGLLRDCLTRVGISPAS